MKLRHVLIENFKGLKHLDMPLTPARGGAPRPLTCIIGDNGSGKTTALQAIALTLSLATRRTRRQADFRWHGFLAERVESLGETKIELTVAFDEEEVELTRALYREWYKSEPGDSVHPRLRIEPSDLREVRLVYQQGRVSSPQGDEALNQFLGRVYSYWLRQTLIKKKLWDKLGDVFWFDQYRNLGTILPRRRKAHPVKGAESWKAGVEQLRESLIKWWTYYVSPGTGPAKTYIKDLERKFGELFPGTTFRGTMPRDTIADLGGRDFYFLLEREGRVYDLAEMASGEQAVFSLLYDFVRLGITRSVVLIDELELHLHAPAQQALYASLPKLGTDCQFFVTTHSEFLTGIIPEEQEVRLSGGRLCL